MLPTGAARPYNPPHAPAHREIWTPNQDEGTFDRRLLIAKWGLVPFWSKNVKIGSRLLCTN